MNLVQHSLITLCSVDGNIERFREEIAYTLLPDAIRYYTGVRQYSHFEINIINGEISWMQFPVDVKNFSKETWEQTEKFLAPDIPEAKTGEETQVQVFEQTNTHLPKDMFHCIKRHLLQDKVYDEFIREKIDMYRKLEGKYFFMGKEYSDSEIRPLISQLETEGVILLIGKIYADYGITVEQEWMDKNVSEVLEKMYPEEMYHNTRKFLKLEDKVQHILKNHQYDRKICLLNTSAHKQLYEDVIHTLDGDRTRQFEAFLMEQSRRHR